MADLNALSGSSSVKERKTTKSQRSAVKTNSSSLRQNSKKGRALQEWALSHPDCGLQHQQLLCAIQEILIIHVRIPNLASSKFTNQWHYFQAPGSPVRDDMENEGEASTTTPAFNSTHISSRCRPREFWPSPANCTTKQHVTTTWYPACKKPALILFCIVAPSPSRLKNRKRQISGESRWLSDWQAHTHTTIPVAESDDDGGEPGTSRIY